MIDIPGSRYKKIEVYAKDAIRWLNSHRWNVYTLNYTHRVSSGRLFYTLIARNVSYTTVKMLERKYGESNVSFEIVKTWRSYRD